MKPALHPVACPACLYSKFFVDAAGGHYRVVCAACGHVLFESQAEG